MFTLIIYPNYPLLEGNRKTIFDLAYCLCKGTTFSSILNRNTFLRSQILTLILITLEIILKNQTRRAQKKPFRYGRACKEGG